MYCFSWILNIALLWIQLATLAVNLKKNVVAQFVLIYCDRFVAPYHRKAAIRPAHFLISVPKLYGNICLSSLLVCHLSNP